MKYEKLFESYNKAIEEATNDFFEKVDKVTLKYDDEDYKEFLLDRTVIWAMVNIAGLGKPAEIIEEIGTKEELLEAFNDAARICNDELPEIFIQKFREFPDDINIDIVKIALDRDLLNDDENFVIPVEAIKITGKLQNKNAGISILKLLYTEDLPEIIYESVKGMLIEIGEPVISELIEKIDKAETIYRSEEYIMMALAEIGRLKPDEKIYKTLKKAFKRMPDKVHGAMCLYDYGDRRAVTILKTYLDNNKDFLDAHNYKLIAGIVRNLGGDI
jgi:hypothetical protein